MWGLVVGWRGSVRVAKGIYSRLFLTTSWDAGEARPIPRVSEVFHSRSIAEVLHNYSSCLLKFILSSSLLFKCVMGSVCRLFTRWPISQQQAEAATAVIIWNRMMPFWKTFPFQMWCIAYKYLWIVCVTASSLSKSHCSLEIFWSGSRQRTSMTRFQQDGISI